MPVIKVQNLIKEYIIGGRRERHRTVREELAGRLKSSLRGLRRRGGGPGPGERFLALNDVSFEVARGEAVGIIGRNGAGKSTLLKILTRITEPTAGRAALSGRVSSLLEVGTGFHPDLTGRENIFLNGVILGMSRAEIRTKFDEIVAFSEIERFLDTPVKRYSSGMYVRLAFAVAAHLEPEILIVDEVLAVGDASFQKKCLGKMEEAGKEGRTVLFVSHNLSAVKSLCSRCILLEDGRIAADSTVEEALLAYLAQGGWTGPLLDLSNSPGALVKDGVDALSIELLNPVADAFAIRWDEPIRLKVRYRIGQKLSNASLAIGCNTADLVPVFTVRSSDGASGERTIPATDTYEAAVSIEHNLRAGQYHLQLGVSSGNRVRYYNPSAARLEIVGIGKERYPERNTGLINCRSEWEL